MTLEEVWSYANSGETIFYVGVFMYQYHVFPARIIGVSISSIDTVPEVEVENLAIGKKEMLSIYAVYINESEALEKCKKAQKEYGHVVITQKEYDELIALKKSLTE